MTSRTYPAGVPCWIDTEQPDVGVAASFYGGAFGWEAEISVPPGFEDAIASFVDASRSEQPHWHVTFAVEDREPCSW